MNIATENSPKKKLPKIKRTKSTKVKISRIITVRLFIAVFSAFIVSTAVTYILMYHFSGENARETMKTYISALSVDIWKGAGKNLYMLVQSNLEPYIEGGEEAAKKSLEGSKYTYFARRDGTIFIAGEEDFIGRNIRDIPEVAQLLDNIYSGNGIANFNTMYLLTTKPAKTLDGKEEVYYIAIVNIDDPEVVYLNAFSPFAMELLTANGANELAINSKVGKDGYYIVIDSEYIMYSNRLMLQQREFPYRDILEQYEEEAADGRYAEDIAIIYDFGPEMTEMNIKYGRGTFWGEDYLYCLNKSWNNYLISLYPVSEAYENADESILMIVLIEIIVFAVLFVVLRLLINHRVVKKLASVNDSLGEIIEGNLEEKVDVRDTYEFDQLSNDINATVDRLKELISEAEARYDVELKLAKAIQSSALPGMFPPFSDNKKFELFASMEAAKEVGGDFYDFYMVNDNTLGLLIADVSGKSIPGAMFMMTAKTVIKSLVEGGLPPAEAFTEANEKLCEGNDADMFLTAWLGYLDLTTGLVRVANAGHNPPVLIHEGSAEYVRMKPGFMLAGMDGIQYKEQTVQMEKGDVLYLYTDGVTEAMNIVEEQYGEKRLQQVLSNVENHTPEKICEVVKVDVAGFTNGAEQSDDITMLCIRYLGDN